MSQETLHETRSPAPGVARGGPRAAEREEPVPYVRYGVPAGLLGASIVALFFLVLDLAAGRAFTTPNALGSALFLDRAFDVTMPLRPAVITGYTAVHGAVFIGISCIAAVLLFTVERLPERGALYFGLTASLFIACEGVFLCLTLLAGFSIWSELGFGRVALANALASAGMAALLARGVRAERARLAGVA